MNDYHNSMIERIYEAYRLSKQVQLGVSIPYRPGGQWKGLINKTFSAYTKVLNNGNVSELSNLLNFFFRNDGSYGLNESCSDNVMLPSYDIWKKSVDGDIRDVSAPFIGSPPEYYIDGHLIMRYSFRHHRFADIVKKLLSDIDKPIIAEIGPGYGGFAYYLLKENNNSTYIGFDLPEVLLLSSYYLMSAFPNRKVLLFGEMEGDLSLSKEIVNDFDIILLPNFEIPKLENKSIDLFINTGSLSEMDMVTINEYILQIARTCKKYFFHENSDREKIILEGHKEISASQFPMKKGTFKKIYERPSLLTTERYKEYLYALINDD